MIRCDTCFWLNDSKFYNVVEEQLRKNKMYEVSSSDGEMEIVKVNSRANVIRPIVRMEFRKESDKYFVTFSAKPKTTFVYIFYALFSCAIVLLFQTVIAAVYAILFFLFFTTAFTLMYFCNQCEEILSEIETIMESEGINHSEIKPRYSYWKEWYKHIV